MQNDWFAEIDKLYDQKKAEWGKIDGLISVLNNLNLSDSEKMMLNLLVLIANQIRPMNTEQLGNIKKETHNIINGLDKVLGKYK